MTTEQVYRDRNPLMNAVSVARVNAINVKNYFLRRSQYLLVTPIPIDSILIDSIRENVVPNTSLCSE